MEIMKYLLILFLALVGCSKEEKSCFYESKLTQSSSNNPIEYNPSGSQVNWVRVSEGVYSGTSDCLFLSVTINNVLPKDDSINVRLVNGNVLINSYRWDNIDGGYFLADDVLDNIITCN